MKKYFIVENGKQTGPFTIDELKSISTFSGKTLVWYQGLTTWTKAESIDELKDILNTPPPVTEEDEIIDTPPIPSVDIHTEYEIASKWARLGSYTVGYLIIIIIVLFIFFGAGGTESELNTALEDSESNGYFLDLLYGGIFGALLNGFFYPFFGGNLGHKIFGLKVINEQNGEPVTNLFMGLLREFLKGAICTLFIPCLWIFFNDKNKTPHDDIMGSLVVKQRSFVKNSATK